MTTVETPPIDPAVERSREIVDALSRLAITITNHPEITKYLFIYASIQSFAGGLSLDEAAATIAEFEPVASRRDGYDRRTAHLGKHVVVTAWAKAERCPECGRP